MRFSCDSCAAQYMISDDKVGPSGVKVRCKKCGHIVLVKRARAEAAAEPVAPAPAPPPAASTEAGLDDEIGQAFDHAFGGGGATSRAPGQAAAVLEGDRLAAPPAAYGPATARGREVPDDGARLAAAPAASEPAPQAAARAEPGGDWYVAIDDKQVGPLAAPAMKARWESGEVGPDSLVWRQGMADWKPLSGATELAQFLAPVPRPAPRQRPAPEPASEPVAERPRAALAPSPPEADPGWKPAAASALAALATEEIAAMAPEAVSPARAGDAKGSLVDSMNLPDSGGVDPTGAIPLPIKGLETTGAMEKRRSSVARATAEHRQKRSAARTFLVASLATALMVGGGAAAVMWYLSQRQQAPGRSAPLAAASAPTPTAAATPTATPTPAPAPTPAATATSAPAAAPTPPATPAPTPAPPPSAAPPPAAAPVQESPQAVASERPAPRKPAARAPRKAPQKVAAVPRAEPPPEPEPRKAKGGDPLLDFGDADADFERALEGGSPKKRSVYVPPAPGSDLPAEVSQAQIQEAVASRTEGLRACLERQQAASPDSHGTLKLRWVIGPDGGVSGVKVQSPEFSAQPIAQCFVGVVRTIRFPRSRTAGQEVVFPFKF